MVTRDALIARFFDLFKNYGFRSITVDDLANEFGISKKTIYKYFNSKKEIIHDVVNYFLINLKDKLFNSVNNSDNGIVGLLKCYQVIIDVFDKITPQFINTLEKYYPGIHKQLIEFRDNTFYNCVQKLISQGVQEGYFRDDLPYGNLIYFHFSLFHTFLFEKRPHQQAPELNASTVMALLINDIRGMTTSEGYSMMEKALLKTN